MASPVFLVTIDDTSPTIAYSPFDDTFGVPNLPAGWNPFYTTSGFATVPATANGSSLGEIGVGNSLHLTSHDGAALAIRWNGTAISLFGTLTPPPSSDISTYTITLDGTNTTNYASSPPQSNDTDGSTGVLAAVSNLTDSEHEIILTVHNPSGLNSTSGAGGAVLSFDRAVVTAEAGLPSSVSSLPPSSTSSPATTAKTVNLPDRDISFNGQWSFSSDLLPGVNASFHLSTNIGDRARLEFNGTAISLSGLTTPSSGAYNVTLDSTFQNTFDARASLTSAQPTVLFFRAGLDSNTPHVLEVINAGPMDQHAQGSSEGTLLVLGAVNVTSAENSSSTSSSHRGLSRGDMAAIAVSAVIAAIVLACLSYVVWRRRRTAQHKRDMLVNPQVARRSRLSFFLPPRPQDPVDPWEKEHSARSAPVDVLHISAGKDFDLADEDEEEPMDEKTREEWRIRKGKARAGSVRYPSQNSDGSFSIDLPDLPPAHTSRPRSYLPGTSQQPLRLSVRQSTVSRVESTSPRSPKPRGPREMHGRDSSRGILLSQFLPEDERAEEGELVVPYLPVPTVSPLRVEFAHEQKPERVGRQDRLEADGPNRLSMGAVSLPRSLQHALLGRADLDNPPIGNTRVTSDPGVSSDSGYSFLDLSSSPNLSSLSRSGSKRSSQSRRTSTSTSATDAAPPADRRPSMALSMTMGPGRTSSRPSITTTNISLQPVTISPPPPVPTPPVPSDISRYGAHPHADLGLLPSPTDSLPLTVSDIHFRHSVQSTVSSAPSQSRRASRVPHPPLPGRAETQTHQREGSQDTRPFIVQKILGLHQASGSVGTPYEGASMAPFWPPGPGSAPGSPGPSSAPPGTSTFGRR